MERGKERVRETERVQKSLDQTQTQHTHMSVGARPPPDTHPRRGEEHKNCTAAERTFSTWCAPSRPSDHDTTTHGNVNKYDPIPKDNP